MLATLTALLLSQTALAVPGQFTHQGRLLDADGMALEDEATITFRIADAESGGTNLWEETQTVSLTNGFYSAILGADEDGNPLDIEVLSQAPVWLELQLDGEGAMFPRSPVHSVPYAAMAGTAEDLVGGTVDAVDVTVGGMTVIDADGEWVGPAPAVSWEDIEGIPEDFADGVDDDTDTDTFLELATSCLDGDVPVWDSTVAIWTCDLDQDTLGAIGCIDGQLIAWSDDELGWVCAEDLDTVLTESDVDIMVSDNGFAMSSEVFTGSFIDLVDLPEGLDDGDDNTQLSETDVDAMVSDNGYAMATDIFSGDFDALTGVPIGLTDGDDDMLAGIECADDDVLIYSTSTATWSCGSDTDTTLTASEVQTLVEAASELALLSTTTLGGSDILTADGHATNVNAHHSATSEGLDIQPATVTIQGTDTQLSDGSLDLGSETDDALTAMMVQTLTAGGDADSLHTHAAAGAGGGSCYTTWGTTTCGSEHTRIYSGLGIMAAYYQQHHAGSSSAPRVYTHSSASDIICVDSSALTAGGTLGGFSGAGLVEAGTLQKHGLESGLTCALCCSN